MGAGFLLSYFCVVRSDAVAVFAYSQLLFSLIEATCSGMLVVLALVDWSCAISAGLDFRPAIEALKHILKLSYPLVNLVECFFPVKTTCTMYVWFANFLLLFHFVIRVASSNLSSCRRCSSVM